MVARDAHRWLVRALWGAACFLVAAGVTSARDSGEARAADTRRPVDVSAPVTPYRFDGDVRELPPYAKWKPGDPVREVPRRYYPPPTSVVTAERSSPDPLVPAQLQRLMERTEGVGDPGFMVQSRNFDGIGWTGVNPPDPTGAVGLNHYIQATNGGFGSEVRIWDKAEPTPNLLASFRMDTLATGNCFGGFTDPIVIYDRHADRFLMSEYANTDEYCVYVSQSSDPVSGGWYAYEFLSPASPDFPKYATWPTDANGGSGSYIMTTNEAQPHAYAFDRGNMLAGNPAGFVRLSVPSLPGFGFQSLTPADLDGPGLPPNGAPAIVMRHRDTEVHSGPAAPGDLLELWSFDVDWNNTANSTLTPQAGVDVADFDSDLCGLTTFECFPQPGTQTLLDPLREVLMFRLQYMHHTDGVETLVGSFVVDVDGTDLGGVRWFELRGGSPGWTVHQEGTYSIDTTNRFMSSIAMDKSKNIAVGYNVSSSSVYPGLRYTGRRVNDPAGTMLPNESTILTGARENASSRYGDYSHMSLDPADDCTFWFTGEANSFLTWRTQIASFRFTTCGCDQLPAALTLSGATNGDNRIDLQWGDSDLDTVTTYEVYRSRTTGGPFEKIADVADSSPGVSGGSGYDFSDLDVDGGIDYHYVVLATDGSTCVSPDSNEVLVTATGICGLEPVFGGVTLIDEPESDACRLDLAWSAAMPECGGPVTYNVYRSLVPGFAPGPSNLLAAGLSGTNFSDLGQLVDGTTYYYVVRAVDSANGMEEDNTIEVGGEPDGISGGLCLPGSTCTDNPLVDVEPEGPLSVCSTNSPTLTAVLNGGSGPFTYQWYDNGQPVAGATGPTFTPNELGTHGYNVRVSAQACGDETFDGVDTVVDQANRPVFAGLTGASSQQAADCAVDLSWNAATSVCPGPVSYSVFRDTVSPVAPVFDNFVAGGLTTTGYTDAEQLASGLPYYYLVKALDVSTSQFDDNTVNLSVAPDGPGSGPSIVYSEKWNDPAVLTDWTLIKGPGAHSCGQWAVGVASISRPAGGSGNYLISDNRCGPPDPPMTSAWAASPVIDLDLPGLLSVHLEVKIRFVFDPSDGVETASVEVWDGTQWIVVWVSNAADANMQLSVDVSAHAVGNPDFQVRFNYQDAVDDFYFSFDNLEVIGYFGTDCATAPSGPPAVPRGSLLANKNAGGVDLTWDAATCSAADYNLLFGNLANVSSYTLQGSVCGLGTSGSFTWNGPPAGDLYFLLVGDDGGGTEGSWGVDHGFAERNGGGASNECGATIKDPTNICF